MEFNSLPNAIFSIEKMVGSEGQAEQLILQLHKLSKQTASLIKAHQATILQNKEGLKERQQLKKRLRKVTSKLEKKEQECQQLQSELVRTKDMYDHKINRLIRSRQQQAQKFQHIAQKASLSKEKKRNKSREVQCQILNEPLVKELQERNVILLRKINQLQKDLYQQKNENNSKQLYIESLLTALDATIEEELQQSDSGSSEEASPPQTDCEDINDASTIDADSLKGQDPQSEYFPQGERKVWHESQFQEVNNCQGWYGSMQNTFKKVKSWISKI